eukprot:CAMPEP_0197891942 /NCGR_PEP_ID=MMETSP1439-20131203/29884_1 /TAXON_ID=66791 /ORGANISM="Gonyaulax spinifera, Strain CCMP409" /LENGTH=54 /DNA_ID=CAMNT_0043512081 /DNA_START=25 /DNA_END=186 /DNA_ORIENTATION=-
MMLVPEEPWGIRSLAPGAQDDAAAPDPGRRARGASPDPSAEMRLLSLRADDESL